MAASINNLLETARAGMAAFTNTDVSVGLPDDSEPGLFIFAYRFAEDPVLRNLEARDPQGSVDRTICLDCLLMASPPGDYERLDEGLRCLTEQPLLNSNPGAIRVTIEDIDARDLSRIFANLQTSYRVVIPFQLKGK